MFCFDLGEAAVGEFFYSRFTFKISFFFRFSTWKWLVIEGNHATISRITVSKWFEFFCFVIALLLYQKSAILGLFFLNSKDLCLPNQFSKAFCQYIPNLMSKKKERLIIDRSKWCQYWFSLKFKRLAILIVHDVKNQSINEQKWAVLERWVNSILYLYKKIAEMQFQSMNILLHTYRVYLPLY